MALEIKYTTTALPATFYLDSNPKTFAWGGTNAEIGSLLVRTDDNTLWRKSGPLSADWTVMDDASGLNGVTWRPGNPGGSKGGVYTTFEEAYAAADAMRLSGGLVFFTIDDRFGATVIPAGNWDLGSPFIICDVSKGAIATTVTLADGAKILAASVGNIVTFWTSAMLVVSNRISPVIPFDGVNVACIGNRTRFSNTLPGVLPMFKAGPLPLGSLIAFGPNTFGGLGNNAALPSPLVDVAGGALLVGGGGGFVNDNAYTDSVGGGLITQRMLTDGFTGGSGPAQTYSHPALIAGAGVLSLAIQTRERMQVIGGIVVGPGAYNASYNEFVRVSTTLNPVTVNAPRATPAKGERVTIKDVGGNALVNNITFAPTGGDVVDNGVINTNGGSGTWRCDGSVPPTWWRVG